MAGLKIIEEVNLFSGPGLETMKKNTKLLPSTVFVSVPRCLLLLNIFCIISCSQQILDVFSFARKTTFTVLTIAIKGHVAITSLVQG